MKLTTTHIIFIVQSAFILVLFLVIVFKKNPDPMDFEYDRIKNDIESSIENLSKEFKLLSKENIYLYKKIDSLKYLIPNNKKSLDRISKEIEKLNDTYTNFNYRDSTDEAIIRRLSRGFN